MSCTRSLVIGFVLVLSACSAPQEPRQSNDGDLSGGVLRVGVSNNALNNARPELALDPQVAYSPEEWALLRCCLARTLLSQNGRPVDEGGLQLRPDLATALPEVSDDRMSWTFRIKQGVHYAPPLDDVEIVAADFVRALERAASNRYSEKFGYAFYYSIIDGFDRFADGEADSIAGLETPDDHTLVVHLREPSTNVAGLFSLHTTSPLPADPDDPDAEYGIAEGRDSGYGRYLVSSGPYMFADEFPIDFSEGFALERNPSWDGEQDGLRPAYPHRIEFTVGTSDSLIAQLDRGDLDVLLNVDHPTEAVERYAADPSLKDRVMEHPTRAVWYAVMNLALPPFDDVRVRKAVNHVIDRKRTAELVTASGDFSVVPYTHIASDSLQDNLLLDYRPYGAPDGSSDLARARAEMSLSRYDSDNDGRCDHQACRDLTVPITFPLGAAADSLSEDLKRIGIDIRVKEVSQDRFYIPPWPERQLALAIGNGWIDDANSAETVFQPLFGSETAGVFHNALIGATPRQLRGWGYEKTRMPNIDPLIDNCAAQVGHRQLRCWAELDAYLMERIVPFAPLLVGRAQRIVSENVVAHSFDASSTVPALDRFAVSEREP